MTLFGLLAVVALTMPAAASGAAAGDAEPGVSVTVMPRIALANQDVMAVVVVPRDDDNRLLTIAVEAPAFYARTERQLDGHSAARVHEFPYKQLPAGEYLVVVRVVHDSGRDEAVEARFSVRGAPADEIGSGRRRPRGRL